MKVSTTRLLKLPLTLLAIFAVSLLSAQSAAKISIQGVLKLSDGSAVEDGFYNLNFKLFDAKTGGTQVHNEDINASVTGGVYSVILGNDMTPLNAAFDVPYFLEVKIGNEILSPRVPMTAAPTALSLIGQDNVFPSTGNVGIGESAPNEKLEVVGGARISSHLVIGSQTQNLSGPRLGLAHPNENLGILKVNSTSSNSGDDWWIGFGHGNNANAFDDDNDRARIGVEVQGGGAGELFFSVGSAGNQYEALRIKQNGKVAMGLAPSTPLADLSINQAGFGSKISLFQYAGNTLTGFGFSSGQLNYHVGTGAADHVFYSGGTNGDGTELMRIEGTGDVSIGGSASARFTVKGNGLYSDPLQFARLYSQPPTFATAVTLGAQFPIVPSSTSLCVYADGTIAAAAFMAISDARVKNVIGQSNSSNDLDLLRQVKITDYTYIDKIAKGNRVAKKVIAQELEAVYPEAVSTITDVVPDIYQLATIKNGRVSIANDLKAGERVQLIFGNQHETVQILAADASGFTVDLEKEGPVFVYGREVDDFRVVDYEALSTLNISATQELLKQLETQQRINTQQQEQISQLQGQLTTLSSLVQGLMEQQSTTLQVQKAGVDGEK